jgi:hypothetical protein
VEFADYSVDELFPTSSFDQSSHCWENRLSTEERAKFDQFNLKIYSVYDTVPSTYLEREETAPEISLREVRALDANSSSWCLDAQRSTYSEG